MQEGIFIAASAAIKQVRKMNVLSNNLANLNNVGFKKDQLVFESMIPPFGNDLTFETSRNALLPAAKSNSNVAYVAVTGFSTDHTQGVLEKTDNILDLALDGKGYFAVQTPAGIRYTRKGNFQLDAQSRLVAQNGFPVLGDQGGPLVIQAQDGAINIDISGNISIGAALSNVPAGKIKIVRFSEGAAMEKEGDGLYRLIDSTQEEQVAEGTMVRQGFLEQSNVNSVEEMTNMITTVRAFEGYQKMIQALDQIDERAVNVLGRLGQ